MRQCQRLTIWSGCPAHAKEKTGRWDPLLTIFVRGPTDVDPKVGDPQMTHGDPGMTFDLSGSMGIHRSWALGRTCTRSGVRLSDTDTHVVPARVLLDGYPSQNTTPASIRVEDSVTLALHPCQTSASHLPCT